MQPYCIIFLVNKPHPRKPPPKDHPKPWASPLSPHLDEIRAMRRARATWQSIAEHLARVHQIKVTFRTVRNFFARAQQRKGALPLGFEAHVPRPAAKTFSSPNTDPYCVDITPESPTPFSRNRQTKKP